jgi:hypothetical protein
MACEALNKGLKEVLSAARDLTVFAWEFRYPGDAPVPSLEEVKEYRQIAGRVYQAIREQLPLFA